MLFANSPIQLVNIRIFAYAQSRWSVILTGQLQVKQFLLYIKVIYKEISNANLIPDAAFSQLNNQKYLTVEIQQLSKIKQQQADKKILYLWIDDKPYCFSFLQEQKATQICQKMLKQLQIIQQYDQHPQLQPQQKTYSEDLLRAQYINALKENNLMKVQQMFQYRNQQILLTLMKTTTQLASKRQLDQNIKLNLFTLVRSAILMADKTHKYLIQRFMQMIQIQQHYNTILIILSWNPSSKQQFDYISQYKKQIQIQNILKITNAKVIKYYETNAKLRFLKDISASIFIDLDNQKILKYMFGLNNFTLLYSISQSEQFLNEIAHLADNDPKMYLNIFMELWEFYQNFDTSNQIRMNKLINQIFRENIFHDLTLRCVNNIVSNPALVQQNSPRFYEKWIELFKQFLSDNWQYSQNLLIQKKQDQALIHIFYNLINNYQDEHLISSILNFIAWFIQPAKKKSKIKTKLLICAFNGFVTKIWSIMSHNPNLIQMYVQFIIKCYKIDTILTRRVLIQNKVLITLNKQIKNKNITICIIKLLNKFLGQSNLDIFMYLANNSLFMGLKQQYQRNLPKNNIINCCFRTLLGNIQKSRSKKEVNKYFSLIFQKIGQ